MEKKTIGQFIAALRKARGMTQKDLAAKLNVSDKAVSRWERDECAPDLSLISVIADIFDVTADELLRGERKPVTSSESSLEEEENKLSAKSQKQIKYLLNKAFTNYKIQCLITVALAFIGIIIAAIINAFSEALLGLGVGLIIYVIAAVCLAFFTVFANSNVYGDEFEGANISEYKKSVAYMAWIAASGIFVIFCATLPLAVVDSAYLGLEFPVWLSCALICILAGLIICAFARFILTSSLIKRGLVDADNMIVGNRRLLTKTAIILVVVLAVTFIVQVIINNIDKSEMIFAEGIQFDNYADFVEYIETPQEMQSDDDLSYTVNVDVSGSDYEEEYLEICDKNENVLCRYIWRNNNVAQVNYSASDDSLPITVYTLQDVYKDNQIMNYINIAFITVYFIEVIVAVVIYRKKRLI